MMFSFKSLAIAAGIAFAAISSVAATPLPCSTCDASTTTGTYVQEKSLVYVLEKAKYDITPVVVKFKSITKETCTVEHVTPLVEELKVVLTGCIGNLHALVGVELDVLLLTSAGVRVTIDVVAGLVADILILVFGALSFVLSLVEGIDVVIFTTLCTLFAVVGGLVGTILLAVLTLCGGVLGNLAGAIFFILKDVEVIIAVIKTLNVSACINLLGLVNVHVAI
ncbi:hypothetical protein QCA50_005927 [Cerrena zonata]|uniref:Transmembrane protein n=1 Tax=Cerrena zonata TaxID=2478898 RepID=A0AAW0GMS1_9APHY